MAPRGNIPPYEIMRRQGEKPAAPEVPVESNPPMGGTQTGESPWWVGATVPIVLRVPRGMALLIVLGLLLLMVLAYWVGSARGRSAAEAHYAILEGGGSAGGGPRSVGRIAISRESDPDGGGEAGGNGAEPQPGPTVIETTYTERRERGLNYFRLVYTSREEGEKIAAFLAQSRIDTQLVLVDNDRSCIVYAVERGFRGDELNSDARRQHESHLRALGNQWRELGSGHSNFNTMIPERYSGPGSD